MKTVQMTLDESLVAEVDRAAAALGDEPLHLHPRRPARRAASSERKGNEHKHRAGYERHPVQQEEFGDWEDEQVWELS